VKRLCIIGLASSTLKCYCMRALGIAGPRALTEGVNTRPSDAQSHAWDLSTWSEGSVHSTQRLSMTGSEPCKPASPLKHASTVSCKCAAELLPLLAKTNHRAQLVLRQHHTSQAFGKFPGDAYFSPLRFPGGHKLLVIA